MLTTKTTIRMDLELHRQLKILAAEYSTTVTAIIDAALREYLAKYLK